MTAVLERPVRLSEPPTPEEPTTPAEPTTPEYAVGRLIIPGGRVIAWDTRDAASVAVATTTFDETLRDGGLAYKTEGSSSEVIRTFDPQAETIILSRPMAGG